MSSASRVFAAAIIILPAAALAQHASDDPVATADDAFGLTLGLEGVGLYGAGGIRGFNPQAAGNVRIDGLYFDQQGGLSNRVVEGSTVRIGVSEIGYPFPAPTGIVDYSLRHATNGTPSASVVASVGPFEARGLSADGNVPIIGTELQLPVGASYGISTNTSAGTDEGYTSTVSSFGAAPQWIPNDRIALRAFFDWQQSSQARTLPTVFSAGDYLPPLVNNYVGQNWAEGRSTSENYGALINARLSSHWSLSAGVFRSVSDNPLSFSDLYLNTQLNGIADHVVVGYPDQSSSSTSGEARVTGRFTFDSWRHELTVDARGRDTLALYGGSDVVDFGQAYIGGGQQVPQPDFRYSTRTHDLTELWSVGLAYRLQWLGRADFSVGIQRESYDKNVEAPGLPDAHLVEQPLRGYSTAAITLAKPLTAYAGYTQGLEDSGASPGSAQNRGAILPAARTWQADVGLRYLLTSKLKIIAGVFQIQKPYFNLDPNNFDRQLGLQRARGLEVSLSGELAPNLNVNAGLLAGKVSIIGSDLRADGIGPVAFGQPRITYQIETEYKLPIWPALSADFVFYRFGAAPASIDNVLYNPGQTLVNIGGRYRFTIFRHAATLRVHFTDLNDARFWNLGLSPGLFEFQGPALSGYLTADI